MLKRYSRDFRAITSNRVFVLCVLLVICISYGFAAVNVTIGIDDLEADRYFGDGQVMLAAGRFTMTLLGNIAGYGNNVIIQAYLVDVLAMIGLAWSAINFCILFRRICGQSLSMAACTVFSCVFASYPLIIEIWEYNIANLCVSFGYLCSSFALISMHDALHNPEKKNWLKGVFAAVLLMLVCAGYESLAVVYVFGVFAVLALQVIYGNEAEKTLKTMLRQGMLYAGVLLSGLILRLVVHQIILLVCNLEAQINGQTAIYWGNKPVLSIIKSLITHGGVKYLLKGIIYLPLTELLIAGAVMLMLGIVACRRHGAVLLLPGASMLVSLFLLSLLQGEMQPYRTCQVFAVFVAFAAMCVIMVVSRWNKLRLAALILCGCICFAQANYINYYLTLNHMRSEEEAHVIRNVGTDLYKNCDLEKPVVFVGDYSLSNSITEAACISEDSLRWRAYSKICNALDVDEVDRKLPETNINSALSWASRVFEQEPMRKLFGHYGFDYVRVDSEQVYASAVGYVEQNSMPAYPQNGYMVETDDCIIVRLG